MFQEWFTEITQFEELVWLRPWVFYLSPLIIVISYWGWRTLASQDQWKKAIDSHLLNFLIQQGESSRSRVPLVFLIATLIIALVALAGPSWQQQKIPVYRTGEARVILLDLSFSMDAVDIKPSRLTRAKHKLTDILNASDEGETALIVYAGDAFVISPLTSDANTINNMVPVLNTGLMPIFGSEPVKAINAAKELFQNAGKLKGKIIWLTDGIEEKDVESIADALTNTSYDLKILAIGTEQGAPIPLPNDKGFLKNDFGEIVMPSLRQTPFQMLSQKISAEYSLLTPDNSDINKLMAENNHDLSDDLNKEDQQENINKQLDQGYWLLFLLVPFMLMLFRKNAQIPGISLMLCLLLFPFESKADWWDDLWATRNQQAQAALNNNQASQAAELFEDPNWKGSAHYRAGEHDAAIDQFSQFDSADALYNKGNALARKGDYDKAIEAYDQALQKNPDMEDAKFNKELLEQVKKQQQEQQQQDKDKQQEQDQKEQEQDQQQESESQDNQEKQDQSQQQESQEQQEQQKQEEMKLEDKRDEAEKDQALEQWLRKIPDDPGGLLRRKMYREYKKRGQDNRYTKEVW